MFVAELLLFFSFETETFSAVFNTGSGENSLWKHVSLEAKRGGESSASDMSDKSTEVCPPSVLSDSRDTVFFSEESFVKEINVCK